VSAKSKNDVGVDMGERDFLKRLSVSSLHELEAKLLEGAEKLDRGEGLDGEAVLARLRQRRKARRTNG